MILALPVPIGVGANIPLTFPRGKVCGLAGQNLTDVKSLQPAPPAVMPAHPATDPGKITSLGITPLELPSPLAYKPDPSNRSTEVPVPEDAPVAAPLSVAPESPALAHHLRGADTVDDHLLDEAVQRLNNLWQAKGLETARAVAECVIDLFFDGRPELFFDRGKTHLSFTALKQRSDLHVSYLFMWNACAVYDQLRRLPTGIAEALPLSHHKLLLPVKDEDKKRELATQAVATGMSKQEFAAEVSKARKAMGDDSKGGRPPLPAFVKAFGKLKAVVELAESEAIDSASFEHYDRAEALALAAEVEGLMGRLVVVLGEVRGAAVGGKLELRGTEYVIQTA